MSEPSGKKRELIMDTTAREFYVLARDSTRRDLQSASRYELDVFDPTLLWNGEPVGDNWSPSITIYVTDQKPTDLLGNALSWTIMSQKLFDLIHPFLNQADYEVFKPAILHASTLRPVPGYLLFNLVRKVPALTP